MAEPPPNNSEPNLPAPVTSPPLIPPPKKIFLYVIPLVVLVLVAVLLSTWTPEWLKSLGGSLGNFSLNGAEYFSGGFAIIGGCIMLILALSFLPDYDRARLALMLEMFGGGAGWILGMFFSPTSQSEQQTFLNAKTALVGIISGYVLSKLQTIFDKMVADGKILDRNFLINGLLFVIPLLLATAAVYNVRAYHDLNVRITAPTGGELATSTDNGKTQYKLPLAKPAHFVAEARFPGNTAVIWSVDPTEGHGTIEQFSGDYKSPAEMPNDPTVDIVATSLTDKTKVDRLQLTLTNNKTPTPTVKQPVAQPEPQPSIKAEQGTKK